jgi:hypothetical protein
MVAPIVRRLFESLLSENKGEQKLATKEVPQMGESERAELLTMLRRQVERHPDQAPAVRHQQSLPLLRQQAQRRLRHRRQPIRSQRAKKFTWRFLIKRKFYD